MSDCSVAMLLAVDIGNTNVKIGIFDGEHLTSRFSIASRPFLTVKELTAAVGARIGSGITDVIVCSVVPAIDPLIREFASSVLGLEPVFVANDIDLGLDVCYEPLTGAGTDRLVNSFAASEKYGVPSIVCSFGTATTFDVVTRDRVLLGGVIAPGMVTMAKALHLNTAKLPEIEIAKPAHIIGRDTVGAIQSGIFYGHIALVEGMLERIKAVSGDDTQVIATGGFAAIVAENTDVLDIVDNDLLLDGLRLILRRSHPA
ncbi:MAG: type III pantothenate kinase, partial [Pyrinomonadaceae bacterium]